MREKGITLIALVVTIIILLILAGVTVGLATSGTGLFEKTKLATNEYNNKAQQEEAELAKASNEIDRYISGNRDVNLTDEVKNYIDTKLAKSAITASSSDFIAVNAGLAKVTLKTIDDSTGSNLTIENGGIKIGRGITHILVSACGSVNSVDGAQYGVAIYLNDTQKYITYHRARNASTGVSSDTCYLSVKEGDIIYLYDYNTSSGGTFTSGRLSVIEI